MKEGRGMIASWYLAKFIFDNGTMEQWNNGTFEPQLPKSFLESHIVKQAGKRLHDVDEFILMEQKMS